MRSAGLPHALPLGTLLSSCLGLALVLQIANCAGPDREPREQGIAERSSPPVLPLADSLRLEYATRADTLRFKSGDHLDGLLRRGGVPAGHRLEIARALGEVYDLGLFRSGTRLTVLRDPRGAILGIHYPLDYERDLCAWRQSNGFAAAVLRADLSWQTRHLRAELAGSFYESLEAQGEEGDLATRVADLFAGEVDFFYELRQGDAMEILVESAHRPDRDKEDHRVRAARLILSDGLHEAFLFPDSTGERHYYHRDGSSLERQFLRAPLNFVRVSSGFSYSRLHPVLKVRRPHPGVDYAAPAGTPIMATADGRVIARARNAQAGRYLKLIHPGNIETSYLHLSRFARGTGPGQRVRKGQVIGYVGQTGLATGAHVDYRIKISGRFVDPRRFRSEPAAPLVESALPAFRERVEAYDEIWERLRDEAETLEAEADLLMDFSPQASGGLPLTAGQVDSLRASRP